MNASTSDMTAEAARSLPVDEILPMSQMILYGLQHVLVMYAGAVAVPLVIGAALDLSNDQIVLLISSDLFVCGAATLLQTLGVSRWLGCRLPVVQGCTFAALIPMVLIGKEYGMGGISGAVMVAGAFTLLCAPWFSKLVRFFPKVVMGSIVTLIGLSIMPVAGGWIGGGSSETEGFGNILSLALASLTLIVILNIYTFASGLIKNVAVLIGLLIGSTVWYLVDTLDFSQVSVAPWLNLPRPLYFSTPEFHLVPIFLLSMVMVVVMVETMSSMMATGEIVGRKAESETLRKGLLACGLATFSGSFFNLFPYAAFAQNVGLINLTGVKSRFVVAVSGAMLILMGLFAKLAALVVIIPKPVLGGAGVVMFGMVAVSGIRSLGQVNYRNNNNGMVVALTLGIGLMPVLVPSLFHQLPELAKMFLHSGITLGTSVAIVANLILNGKGKKQADCVCQPDAQPDATETTAARRVAVKTARVWLLMRRAKTTQQKRRDL
ncbi:nucleobase:cation symporter-2 family protein [Erwinia oleae]|uniref:nucleobase:cation symporter-2 family protein n=1 Tax=Erwinia oleae TaxID=796334 RepID=UPI00068DD8CD|nr:nucleobase:cation symporter-2 family protein [Erwinia oleae]